MEKEMKEDSDDDSDSLAELCSPSDLAIPKEILMADNGETIIDSYDYEIGKKAYRNLIFLKSDHLSHPLELHGRPGMLMDVRTMSRLEKEQNKKSSKAIVQEIRKRQLPIPLVRYFITDTQLKQAYFNLRDYIPHWTCRSHDTLKGHDSTMWLPSLFRGKPCQLVVRKNDWWSVDIVSDCFVEYERVRAKKIYAPSLIKVWNDDSLLASAIEKHTGALDVCGLRECIFRATRELVPFRASRARALVLKLLDFKLSESGSAKGLRWLDISSGWGDRLAAACSLDMDYLGFDPNPSLVFGHQDLIKTLNQFRNDPKEEFERTRQRVICKPFECEESLSDIENDVRENGLFDLCLVSPPFYIIEKYNGPNQSTDLYKDFDDWLINFLWTSFYNAWSNIKNNGIFAFNIADIKGNKMVEPTLLCIEEYFPYASWEGIITFSGRSTQDVPGIVYVWKKKINPVRWNPDKARNLKESYPHLDDRWKQKMWLD